uniref:Uncharacterized protein n=1 Tax=Piliocolobus tephrosceles TaxID=591936 RepID=A0A8C9LRH6_9PRIM
MFHLWLCCLWSGEVWRTFFLKKESVYVLFLSKRTRVCGSNSPWINLYLLL